jgi:hypothetical protein
MIERLKLHLYSLAYKVTSDADSEVVAEALSLALGAPRSTAYCGLSLMFARSFARVFRERDRRGKIAMLTALLIFISLLAGLIFGAWRLLFEGDATLLSGTLALIVALMLFFRAVGRRAVSVPVYVASEVTRVEFPQGECTAQYEQPSIEVGGLHEYIVSAEASQVLYVSIFSEDDAAFFNIALMDEAGRVASYITRGDEQSGHGVIETRGEYRIAVFPGAGYRLQISLFESEQQAAA